MKNIYKVVDKISKLDCEWNEGELTLHDVIENNTTKAIAYIELNLIDMSRFKGMSRKHARKLVFDKTIKSIGLYSYENEALAHKYDVNNYSMIDHDKVYKVLNKKFKLLSDGFIASVVISIFILSAISHVLYMTDPIHVELFVSIISSFVLSACFGLIYEVYGSYEL